MNSIRREKYRQISTLDQLRLERAKLDLQMDIKELELQYDWQEIKGELSIGNIARSVFHSLGASSFVSGLQSGIHMLTGLFGSKRDKHYHGTGCGCGY